MHAEDAALRLSPDERLSLIARLWDSLVDERGNNLTLSPETRAELDRRLDDHHATPDQTLTWSEIQRRVRNP